MFGCLGKIFRPKWRLEQRRNGGHFVGVAIWISTGSIENNYKNKNHCSQNLFSNLVCLYVDNIKFRTCLIYKLYNLNKLDKFCKFHCVFIYLSCLQWK